MNIYDCIDLSPQIHRNHKFLEAFKYGNPQTPKHHGDLIFLSKYFPKQHVTVSKVVILELSPTDFFKISIDFGLQIGQELVLSTLEAKAAAPCKALKRPVNRQSLYQKTTPENMV